MKPSAKRLAVSAAVAALYVTLSLLSSVLGLAFGPLQLRLSEALCVLPYFLPGSLPGLVLGCLISNLLSPYGVVDLVCGTLATLLAACATKKMPRAVLAPLPPVLLNGIIIGGMLAWYEKGFASGFWRLTALNGLWVALGEAVSCCILGGLLLKYIPRLPVLRDIMKGEKR